MRRGLDIPFRFEFEELRQDGGKHLNQAGVKVFSAVGVDVLHDFLNRPRLFVGPLHAECVKHIGQCHDAGGLRNFIALQAARVTTAVPFFVVPQGHFGGQQKVLLMP